MIKRLSAFVGFLCFFTVSTVFSDYPYRHSLGATFSLYRFSYSEEFDKREYNVETVVIGKLRSDEYGSTAGSAIQYQYYQENRGFTFGLNMNYARSINHTYDGSMQEQRYVLSDGSGNWSVWYVYEPAMIKNKENYFFDTDVKLGFWHPSGNKRMFFEPQLIFSFNGWIRPIDITEKYYWFSISPAIFFEASGNENLNFFSRAAISIPCWEKMYLTEGNLMLTFDIGGKVGADFEMGFARHLSQDRTIRISYFYKYYGFKKSPWIPIDANIAISEPASSTHINGVKISFERGFGGK